MVEYEITMDKVFYVISAKNKTEAFKKFKKTIEIADFKIVKSKK